MMCTMMSNINMALSCRIRIRSSSSSTSSSCSSTSIVRHFQSRVGYTPPMTDPEPTTTMTPPLRHGPLTRICRTYSSTIPSCLSNKGGDSSTTSSSTSSSSSNHAFDRDIKALQRDGAGRAYNLYTHEKNKNKLLSNKPPQDDNDDVNYDYFQQEIASRLVDRLDDIKREEGFPLALDIGAGAGYIHQAISAEDAFDGIGGGIGGVRKLVQLDSSSIMLHRGMEQQSQQPQQEEALDRCSTYKLHHNEEGTLPFPDGTFDLVMSSVALHWVNDLPYLFQEVKRILKPDGCFMMAMVGGSTLPELRASLVLAEQERDGGVSPHVGPYVELSDIGSLLTNAGLSLPTVDVDTIKIGYPNAMVLMEHLQRMGEGNACLHRRPRTSQDTFLAAACVYDELFRLPNTEEGAGSSSSSSSRQDDAAIEASVQIIYAIGWSPHESQQQPKARGTATHKVGDMMVEHTTTPDKEHP